MRKRNYIAAALVSVVLLSGCTNPETPVDPDSSSTIDTVTMAVNGVPDGLTASKWGGAASHIAFTGLGSQLFAYVLGDNEADACATPDYGIKGRLAESWKFNEDNTGLIVKLRDLTSQWGNKLSAEDVKWSFETGFERDTVARRSLGSAGFNTDDVATIIDEKTVQLNLTERLSFSDTALQQSLFNIYDSTEAKKHITPEDPIADEWLSNNLADYSGWKLDSFTAGSNLTVSADPNWEGERGPVTKVVVNGVPNTATRAELVMTGRADIANGFNFDQYAAFEDAGFQVKECASMTRDTLMLNTRSGPLSDKRVRQAISMALDREKIAEGAYDGLAEPSIGAFAFSPGESKHYHHDLEGAKELLADAGYPDGFPLKLTYGTSRPGPVVERSAVLVRSQLAEVGIDVSLDVVANATNLTTVLQEGQYEALMYADPIVIADPAFYTFAFYYSNARSNSTGWGDPEYDRLRDELAATPTDQVEKREEIQRELSAVVDDAAANLSLVIPKNVIAVRDGLSGAKPSSNGQIHFNDLGR